MSAIQGGVGSLDCDGDDLPFPFGGTHESNNPDAFKLGKLLPPAPPPPLPPPPRPPPPMLPIPPLIPPGPIPAMSLRMLPAEAKPPEPPPRPEMPGPKPPPPIGIASSVILILPYDRPKDEVEAGGPIIPIGVEPELPLAPEPLSSGVSESWIARSVSPSKLVAVFRE